MCLFEFLHRTYNSVVLFHVIREGGGGLCIFLLEVFHSALVYSLVLLDCLVV